MELMVFSKLTVQKNKLTFIDAGNILCRKLNDSQKKNKSKVMRLFRSCMSTIVVVFSSSELKKGVIDNQMKFKSWC